MYFPPAFVLFRILRDQKRQLEEAIRNLALISPISTSLPLPAPQLEVEGASTPPQSPGRAARQSLLKSPLTEAELPLSAHVQTNSRLSQLELKLDVVKATGWVISTQLACTGFLLLGYVPLVGETVSFAFEVNIWVLMLVLGTVSFNSHSRLQGFINESRTKNLSGLARLRIPSRECASRRTGILMNDPLKFHLPQPGLFSSSLFFYASFRLKPAQTQPARREHRQPPRPQEDADFAPDPNFFFSPPATTTPSKQLRESSLLSKSGGSSSNAHSISLDCVGSCPQGPVAKRVDPSQWVKSTMEVREEEYKA